MAPSSMAGGMVKVEAICGSLRKGSYNRGLIRSAIELSKGAVEGVEIEEVTLLLCRCSTPILKNRGPSPGEVEAFCQKILKVDSMMFASPEYNFTITKHDGLGIKAIKHVGRQSCRHCKSMRVARRSKRPISSSPNWNIIDLHFLNKPEFFLKAFEPPPKFNPLNGDLIDEDAKLRLKQMPLSLKAFTLQIHHNN